MKLLLFLYPQTTVYNCYWFTYNLPEKSIRKRVYFFNFAFNLISHVRMKIVYNVTVSVDEDCAEEWTAWMLDEHIPDVMNTGHFEQYTMQEILTGKHENGITYAIQYIAPSFEAFKEYESNEATRLQQAHHDRFGGRYAAFRTLMKIISKG